MAILYAPFVWNYPALFKTKARSGHTSCFVQRGGDGRTGERSKRLGNLEKHLCIVPSSSIWRRLQHPLAEALKSVELRVGQVGHRNGLVEVLHGIGLVTEYQQTVETVTLRFQFA